ncbi:hypothetical protein Sme01_37970 [Sphaerisporangium melleum]|uniref:CHAT domain-containing protein n=1 Tax=Sphaerisporangium melleum TaxID=321316 RepID=A0A917VUH1_9ACTN|nr:CHAT domain-containing protein [Sphaerisporangium melleum]GGL20025.1 hypothetical protein GCM10007964_72380 [Sphaerisporangium melleum]GII71321.1 hypothetical protein Sme01_37970 [Sphaerisporangium melleum]
MEFSGADPARARERASAVLAEARARGCQEAVSIAHRALGLAARELGHLEPAEEHLQEAIRAARGLPGRAAQARLSLVAVRAELGDPVGALRVADLAEGHLTGLDSARLGVQRSVALVRVGRTRDAVAECDRAITVLTGAGDPRFLAGALLNRGLAHTYLEDYDAAGADLSACVTVARAAGLDHIATLAEANVPFVATRRGDLAAAFAGYREAEAALAGYPERLAAMRGDFAGALLAAYLPGEARALLGRAVPELAATGSLGALAESRLLLAQVELLVGDPHQARVTAETAARELAGQGRHAWVPLAEEVILRARITIEAPASRDAEQARRLASQARALALRLAAEGWTAPAAALRLTAAELTLAASVSPALTGPAAPPLMTDLVATGEAGVATAMEADLAAVTDGPPPAGRAHRVVRHHALALRHGLAGDLPRAFSALRAGLAEAAAGGERLSDPGVRAHAVRAGERLAAFGLALALRDGRPEQVLSWSEHCRAVARGRAGGGGAAPPPDRIRAVLDGAALVELVRDGDRLAAVVVTEERCVLRPLGSYTAAAEATIRLRYALRRAGLRDTGTGLASGPPGEAAGPAELFRPLGADVGDRPVVIVPTGALHTLPWGVLPPLLGRAHCVAASAGAWLASTARRPSLFAGLPADGTAQARPEDAGPVDASPAAPEENHADGACAACSGRAGRARSRTAGGPGPRCEARLTNAARWPACPAPVVAIAGPGLRYAEGEAAMVVRTYRQAARRPCPPPPTNAEPSALPGARQVTAKRAEVLDALARAEIAHIAAHGFFSARSPLLSSIALEDGPLMAYDLLALERSPWLVVLSACDAGMAHAPMDGASLGLAGTFLDQGAACVIAGLVPIRDAEALAVMTLVHALLAGGHTPAEALATAALRTGVHGFTCMGSLGRPLPPPARR